MPFDKSVWGTPGELHQRIYARAANGDTCMSYFADGRYNLGGWATYPMTTGPNAEKDAAGRFPKGLRENS